MMKSGTTFGLPILVLGSALGVSAFAQSSATPTQTTNDQPAATSSSTMSPSDNTTYATGKPLQDQSKEGFWGHMNPFARKKWVNRQTAPIKDQVNELDQVIEHPQLRARDRWRTIQTEHGPTAALLPPASCRRRESTR